MSAAAKPPMISALHDSPATIERNKFKYKSLRDAERAAKATGQLDRLHLWPDHEALGAAKVVKAQENPAAYLKWLRSYWNRVSEWPGKTRSK